MGNMGINSEKGTVIWTRRVLGESSRRLGLGARVGDLARQGDNISPSLRATGICEFQNGSIPRHSKLGFYSRRVGN